MRLLIPLFSPATGTWGGLTRVIAVAEAARAAGHEVAFSASGFLQRTLEDRGYRVYPQPAPTFLGVPPALSKRIEQRSQNVTPPVKPGQSIGSIWLVLLFSGYARAGFLADLAEAELAAIDDFSPDALFTDLDPGATLVHAITDLPLTSTYASIMEHGTGTWAWRQMFRAMSSVLRHYQRPVPKTLNDLTFGPRILKIIPSVPTLDDTDPNRPDVKYVGHLLGDIQAPSVDRLLATEQRCVFVYVGTGSLTLDSLRTVLPQVFPAGSSLKCLVGSQSIVGVERVGNVAFYPYVPARDVLPQADWTICHGGQNTIIQSLMHGVPLLIFPGAIFERRFNAQKIKAAGAGFMGEQPDFSMDWICEHMGNHSDAAREARVLGDETARFGGAQAAVKAIEEWE